MKVLVAYASRHGTTRGIAERIAGTLERAGLDVTLEPVEHVRDASAYDAFVIGAAAYYFHWLKPAQGFVRSNRALLETRPVWLFSSGPLGPDVLDEKGRDPRVAAEPREWPALKANVRPRDQRVFFGAYDPDAKPAGLMERFTFMMPGVRKSMPVGDFRDWTEIEAWADAIGRELLSIPATAGS